mmetsp:Transcript_15726/g.20514  ORF Transcript_15726/g.20514 Transcript_15726/m.20514 type:complete len:130 (+) Transcript_15726:94-483(+)|eukprot:CAMPEP_0198148156 /NCGR_PEP_ID=MMETSP1443-20131203/40168_1 /TAXON_ID=186043 /ORGANISM="Entomoneis sp., Strain CCMP2396" /LENGTH=129 /DNA_ID=CAMNT_0043812773 /DNA_START=77 /DNA_END=466 /DNA_ORIENTATION=+
MPVLLKIKWTFKEGRRDDFAKNQETLAAVMAADHPGVICYHVDYPIGENYSEWVEIYANDEVLAAHLANEKGKAPLGVCIDASAKIECRCWGNPNDATKEILAGFGATYHGSGGNSFMVHPNADKDSTA